MKTAPKTPASPLPDLITQINEARQANALAHQLHNKRQHRHLNVKPAPGPPAMWGTKEFAADFNKSQARTSVRQGMGFSSSPKKKPDAKSSGWG